MKKVVSVFELRPSQMKKIIFYMSVLILKLRGEDSERLRIRCLIQLIIDIYLFNGWTKYLFISSRKLFENIVVNLLHSQKYLQALSLKIL